MILIEPATTPNHGPILADIVLSAGAVATKAGALATELAYVATQVQAIVLKIESSNRGVGVGVKNAFAGQNYATNVAVIQRRNTLAGADDQFPIPTKPVGL